jgi:hypothetical protein
MVELVATGIITVSSMVLFGYWLRCAWLLILCEYLLPKSVEATQNRSPNFQPRQGGATSELDRAYPIGCQASDGLASRAKD